MDHEKLNQFLGTIITDMGAAASAVLVRLGDRLGLYRAMGVAGPLTPAGYPGTYDLVCCVDALHDMGDPVGAARHAAATLNPAGRRHAGGAAATPFNLILEVGK